MIGLARVEGGRFEGAKRAEQNHQKILQGVAPRGQATSSNQWTVPVGGGLGKTVSVRGETMSFQVQ